ncbi:MAG: Gfo/Idh/MocA family protein [Candidatus Hydrogenedentota bacterium]
MTDTIRWGVVGSGGIARRRTIPEGIVPADNAQLAAVYDQNAAVNAEVADEFGAQPADSMAALLASGIDAVYVATPVHVHYEQVVACAAAGKHVLCEKPLGMSVGEGREMIQACKAADVQLSPAFMMRFHAQHQAALALVQEGKLGKPAYARAQLSCWFPPMEGAWRQNPALGGGGSLMDLGGHCVDLLEMFFGKVVRVSCFVNNTVHAYPSEDSAVAMLAFENGAFATVDAFFCIPDSASKNALEIYGAQGSILAKGTIGQGEAGDMTAFLEEEVGGYSAQQERDEGGGITIAPAPVNMYRAEIEAFSQALLEHTPAPIGPEVGLRSQQILTACYKSAKTGKAVETG